MNVARRRVLLAIALIAVLVAAVAVYASLGGGGTVLTSTETAYSIGIEPLNDSISTPAGSTVEVLFNVTSPEVGPLYFYATDIPSPGTQRSFGLQNVTAGDLQLPPGVEVSYPTGQAVFGTDHAILALRITFSPDVNGTVGLLVGAFQQGSQNEVDGSAIGYFLHVFQG